MSEIESKRKELEEIDLHSPDRYDNGKLVGFNLGVKLAEKEFHTSKCPICAFEKAEIKRQAQKEFLDFLNESVNEDDLWNRIARKIRELKKEVEK